MKKGASSLNPYATSYVPLSKRGAVDGKSKYINSTQELQSGNETVWYGHQPDNTLTRGQHQTVPQSYVGAGAFRAADFSKSKDHHGGEFYASSSHYQNEMPEKSNFDEDSDMDLAYLLMTYPGISEESLSDVYLANRCDLDAAVDMLNQLEAIF
ncbi:hypothetical protein ACJIZ3_001530 [Penstemon smallii]|uniref:CUE domain-containing protein n=1 Tax=Penstemon smallii TaxID=265156 RepID=A0ABD3U403_9LAMI